MPAPSPAVERRSRVNTSSALVRDLHRSTKVRSKPSPQVTVITLEAEKPKVKVKDKSRSPRDKEIKELKKLLTLLKTPLEYEQTLDVLEGEGPPKTPQWPAPHSRRLSQQEAAEALALEQFSARYQNERSFHSHAESKLFTAIFHCIIKQRLENRLWTDCAAPQCIVRVLTCLRILMRDSTNQREFMALNGVKSLAEHLRLATLSYLTYGDTAFVVDVLTQLTNIFQKMSAHGTHQAALISHGVHHSLVLLMSANDVVVLHCTLHALICLAQSPEPRRQISALNSMEVVLRIIQDYDIMSKKLAANLLRLLCGDPMAREMIKVYDGIPILLSMLQSDGVKLLVYVVWCLVQLSEDPEASHEIRQRGGIPLLLSLLGDRKFVSDRTVASGMSTNLKSPAVLEQIEEVQDQQLNLKSACCACLAELVLNDTNAQQIVQSNGIYSIGQLMVPPERGEGEAGRGRRMCNLQANAFRAMRFLFSIERNRQRFMRLFPPDMFETFIDIGHYNRSIDAYECLVTRINSLKDEALRQVRENLELTNQLRPPTRYINDYAVLELLGVGGYGSVYKVKKDAGQSYMAMKELNTTSAMWGMSTKERMKSVGDVVNELTIIKEQLKHPNVVKYYKTFIENDRLYIVMDLIEGAPIGEHFKSLKEKGERFSEDRIWNIFLQLVLALRYLHKDKKIVHRDLTPNNIMLGEGDRVTITDFGLAKVKQGDCSKMLSQVGTIFYSCPEVIQHKPYGEKADIWAIGCILYQMCTLTAPFCTNLLSLALKIVNAEYEPVPEGLYSEKVTSTIRMCITADPDNRPDIIGVAAHIADILLVHMDGVKKSQATTEKKLEHERRRTRKHFDESAHKMQCYHQLYQVTHERYDKLVNLASSGGGSSMKDGSDVGEAVSDTETQSLKSRRVGSPGTDPDEPSVIVIENGWATDEDPYSSGSDSALGRDISGRDIPGLLNPRGVRSQRPASRSPDCRGGHPRSPDHQRTAPRSPDHRGGQPDHQRTGPRSPDHGPCRPGPLEHLHLDISQIRSIDSGTSSGDPSPNHSSSPPALLDPASLDYGLQGPRPGLRGTLRNRPGSAMTGTLTVSQKKVREITDPILQMLHQLHKILYISQLPPTLTLHASRRVIHRYKHALFAPQTNSTNLKNELRKLLIGSKEVIDLDLGPLDNQVPSISRQQSQDSLTTAATEKRSSSHQDSSGLTYDHDAASDIGVTYERMQNIIEQVLLESGYYNITAPLGGTRPASTSSRTSSTSTAAVPGGRGAPPRRSMSTPSGAQL